MNTYKYLNHISTVIVILLLGFLSLNAQETKKNLLFIITDQQRSDALSIAGNPVLQTPNLDRMAHEGVYFENAYTPCAVCGPARASILTGHTVENTGVNSNSKTYDYDEEVIMTMPTFDEILTDNGYRCEYYGKWHTLTSKADIYQNPVKTANNGKSIFGSGGQSHIYRDYLNANEPVRELEDGQFWDSFTKWPYNVDPLDKYYGMTAAELEAQNLKHSQPDHHGELIMSTENTMTAFQAKQTIEALERLKDETFSITCSFHYPHSPILPVEPYYNTYPAEEMQAPFSISDDMLSSPYIRSNSRLNNPEYADPEKIKYMISNYYGLVKEIDDWIGEILDKLEELGLAENTMVIFTSDHGEMLGAHGMREKNVFYEESAKIPLLMRFPGEIEQETMVDGYISLVDLFPTILDYLGVEQQPSDGKSLRGLVEGTDSEHGKYVVTEWDTRGDIDPNYMIVKDGWKLIMPYTESSTVTNALYDLNTDPYEMNNLLADYRTNAQYYDKVEDLRASLLEWLETNGSKHYEGVKARELTASPYVPKAEVLVERSSSWRYMDDGTDLGTAWRDPEFDDSSWKSGQAELGFGDDDEATTLQSGHITYYFRHTFNVDTLSNYKSPMYLDILVDDGAVVYLNGQELSKTNMPSGEITFETFAKSDVVGNSEFDFHTRLYVADGLKEGANILAVEVHQSSADSDDLSFDLGLEATDNPVTGILSGEQNLPRSYLLHNAYPNPFNPTTTIKFQMPESEHVQLSVYDMTGRKVATLIDKRMSAGEYKVELNASSLSSGIYIYRIQMGTFSDAKKLIVLK